MHALTVSNAWYGLLSRGTVDRPKCGAIGMVKMQLAGGSRSKVNGRFQSDGSNGNPVGHFVHDFIAHET